MHKIPRHLESFIIESLKSFPVVYISGPRQSGKTTLVKRIASNKADYITFDDIQMRSAAQQDPMAFLRNLSGPVVIDEVQMVPELFRPLKMIVDENRDKKNGGKGQFLLTGSASVMALPKLSDALVGRMALHTLLPFSSCELESSKTFIERAFENEWKLSKVKNDKTMQMPLAATFPEISDIHSEEARNQWCNGYLNTILQRDVRILMEIEKIASLPDMLKLLASRSGGVLNEAALSRETELNHLTTKKYRVLLENLFLTLSIPAWSSNLGKKLVKSPKVYLSDINFLMYLLNMNFDGLAKQNRSLFGQVLESFVAIEITKQLTFSKTRAKLYHFRTNSGQEVDFLLEGPDGKIVALEVKSSQSVTSKDFRHLKKLKEDLGDKFLRGFVAYTGDSIVPFGDDLFSLPLAGLWKN